MGQNSQKWLFWPKYQSYLEFFSQSHLIGSELGQIYLSRALETDTRVIFDQKQAKNGLEWPKMAKISILVK